MDQWTLGLGIGSNNGVWLAVTVLAGCIVAIVLIGAAATKLRYGGVLKEVGRSALMWAVVGCDVGPAEHHKSSLIYWRVGYWRIAGRPDLMLKHRLLPIIEIMEIKSKAKPRPSPYEFFQAQIYLSAAGQAYPWFIRRAYLVYPGKVVTIRRSREALRFLKKVLSDVKAHLSSGLSAREEKALEDLVNKSIG